MSETKFPSEFYPPLDKRRLVRALLRQFGEVTLMVTPQLAPGHLYLGDDTRRWLPPELLTLPEVDDELELIEFSVATDNVLINKHGWTTILWNATSLDGVVHKKAQAGSLWSVVLGCSLPKYPTFLMCFRPFYVLEEDTQLGPPVAKAPLPTAAWVTRRQKFKVLKGGLDNNKSS